MTDTFTVRPATPDDAQAISTIATQTFALACPPGTPESEITRYVAQNLTPACFESALANRDLDVRVLEQTGNVVGYSLVTRTPESLGIAAADGISELTRCYVAPAQHGTGAAQSLISATLAGTQGGVRLTVNDQNPRAIRFYERNGFEVVGETTFLCGDDVHRDLVMVRRGVR